MVSGVKLILPHFQMCRYMSMPSICNVAIKRNRVNWRIQTGSLPTRLPRTNLIFIHPFTLRWLFSKHGPETGSICITGNLFKIESES